MIIIVFIEAASSLEKLLCGKSLCGSAHSIRKALSCSCLVHCMTSVASFCVQRSVYVVINKTSGGPGDFRTIFSFFLQECWLHFSVNTETLETGHLNTGFLCFSLAWSKYADGTQETNCCCILLMQPSQFKFLKLSSQQQRPTFCHSSYLIHLRITKTLDKP